MERKNISLSFTLYEKIYITREEVYQSKRNIKKKMAWVLKNETVRTVYDFGKDKESRKQLKEEPLNLLHIKFSLKEQKI